MNPDNARPPGKPEPTAEATQKHQIAVDFGEIVMRPILDLILNDPTRLERDEAHIAALADDYAKRLKACPTEHPVQTPLRVTPEGVIIAGGYRYLAGLRAGLRQLPCIVLPRSLNEGEQLIEQVKDNQLHKPYSSVEQARNIIAVRRLQPHLSQGQAAAALGIHPTLAPKLLKVLNHYPADLHPLIGECDGSVPFTSAYYFAQYMEAMKDEAKVREWTEKVVKGLLTRDDAVELVRKSLGKGAKKTKPVKLAHGGVTAVIKGNPLEALKAFIAKASDAIKRLERDNLPPEFLGGLMR